MGTEAGGECTDGCGVVEPPVHAGLLAASGDIGPACGLDGAGPDIEALLSELPVLHLLGAVLDVGEFAPSRVFVVQGTVAFPQMLGERGAAESVEDGLGASVCLFDGSGVIFGEFDAGVEVFAGMVEVVGEDDGFSWEGVADDVGYPPGAVADDLYAEGPRAVPPAVLHLDPNFQVKILSFNALLSKNLSYTMSITQSFDS